MAMVITSDSPLLLKNAARKVEQPGQIRIGRTLTPDFDSYK
jgi:hypothetical protein